MNKEQIKKFWEDYKEEIIGGILILGTIAIIGGSVGSASNASKQALATSQADLEKASQVALKAWEESKIELRDIGAVFPEDGNAWSLPTATKEVVEKFLEKGNIYRLDILKEIGGAQRTLRIILIRDE